MSILDRIFGWDWRGGSGEEDLFANPLTWRCDICREMRPDEKISVWKVDIGPKALPGAVIRNVKFCNDKPACESGAENWKEAR